MFYHKNQNNELVLYLYITFTLYTVYVSLGTVHSFFTPLWEEVSQEVPFSRIFFTIYKLFGVRTPKVPWFDTLWFLTLGVCRDVHWSSYIGDLKTQAYRHKLMALAAFNEVNLDGCCCFTSNVMKYQDILSVNSSLESLIMAALIEVV